MTYTERYYQREARFGNEEFPGTQKGLAQNESGLLHLGTGAGKTSIVAKDIESTQDRCLFLGDQEELLSQPVKAFRKIGNVDSAIEQAQNYASLDARVVVASSQTMIRRARRERFPQNHFSRIYIDEAHRGSDRDAEICDWFETAKRIGLTATPFRQGLRDLSRYFDTVFYSKPMLNLCAEGFAPPMSIFHLPVEIDLQDIDITKIGGREDYRMEDVDSTITPDLERIAAVFAEHAKYRHTLAYLPLIKTSEAFAAALRNVGVNAWHIEGGSPNREQLLEAFQRGEIECLTNAGVISTGVDLPVADCFLNLRPLKSMNEYQQSAGRTMRALPGLIDHLPEKDQAEERIDRIAFSEKPNSLMFDLLWQHDRLGVMTPAHLIATSDEEAEEMIAAAKRNLSPEDLIALQLRVQTEREAKLLRALEQAAMQAQNARATPVNQVAMMIGARWLLNYEPIAKWEMAKASDKQLAVLARWGVDINTVESKGQAAKLMDAMGFRFEHQFATLRQIKAIMRINERRNPEARVADPSQLSFNDAAAIISADSAERHLRRLRPPEDRP